MTKRGSSRFSNKTVFSEAVKTLRKFADGFGAADGYDIRQGYQGLSPYQKRKLRQYISVVEEQTARPFKFVRPRNKKRLRALQDFSQQEKNLKGLKVAFVPVSDPSESLEVRYDRNNRVRMVVEGGNIFRREILFDRDLLLIDAARAAENVLQRGGSDADRLVMMAGAYEIPRAISASQNLLAREIRQLQEKYGADKFDPANKNSKFFGNWMHGVIAYSFENNTTWENFRREKSKVKRLLAEARRTRSQTERERLLKELKKYNLSAYKNRTRGKKK